MADKRMVTISIFDASSGETPQMALLCSQAAQLEVSVFVDGNVVPALSERLVTLKPFLQKIIKRNGVHIAAQFVTHTTGCYQIILGCLSAIASTDNVLSSHSVASNKRKRLNANLDHLVSAVTTSVILWFREKINR